LINPGTNVPGAFISFQVGLGFSVVTLLIFFKGILKEPFTDRIF